MARKWRSKLWQIFTGSDPENPIGVPLDDTFRRARRNTYIWSLITLLISLYATRFGEVATPVVPIEMPPLSAALGSWFIALYMIFEYLREYRPIDRSMRKLYQEKKADNLSNALNDIENKMKDVVQKGSQYDTNSYMMNVKREHLCTLVYQQMTQISFAWDAVFNSALDAGLANENEFPDKQVPANQAGDFWKDAYLTLLRLQSDWNDEVKRLANEAAAKVAEEIPKLSSDPPELAGEAIDAIKGVRLDLDAVRAIHNNIAQSDQRSLLKDHLIAAILFILATLACFQKVYMSWVS